MKRIFFTVLISVSVGQVGLVLEAKDAGQMGAEVTQQDEDFGDEGIGDEGDQEKRQEEERKKREEDERIKQEEEKKRQSEEAIKAESAKREANKNRLREERQKEAARANELDALRERAADATEYTLDPSSVELVVELDPNGYGFRTRSHRMLMSLDADFLLRGRSLLHYDYRFFNYLSFGLMAGIDWTNMSLFNRFREDLSKRSPAQFTVMGGISAKWRLTEWYMKSAFFLEPSILFGHMWQTLAGTSTTHWPLRPGVFGGFDSVFDSGLGLTARIGVEFPVNFGTENPIKELADPLLVVGFGFAI